MSEHGYISVFGLEILDIPKGSIVTDGIFLLKVMDPQGSRDMFIRVSPTMSAYDIIGMLEVARTNELQDTLRRFEPARPEEDDDA